MQASTIWTEETSITSSQADFQKRLKPSGFFEIMQDAATNHAGRLGFGYEDLQARGLAWVLARKKVVFYSFPEMGDKITVQTWPKGVRQKVFFMRDHLVLAADGRRLAASTSAYVLVSVASRRIVLPDALEVPVPGNPGLNAIDEPLDKLAAAGSLEECYALTAGYSSVDLMGHVNNARYIEWISDCFSIEEHRLRHPAWLQINYMNEVRPGETVRLMRGSMPANGAWYITAENQRTGARAFEAELAWE